MNPKTLVTEHNGHGASYWFSKCQAQEAAATILAKECGELRIQLANTKKERDEFRAKLDLLSSDDP